MPKIVTRYIYPPIPTREFDWCAFVECDEELSQYGSGRTEEDAITDLVNAYLQAE